MNQNKIGSFIAECRKKKKFTQEQLGEKLGVSAKSISNWENGRNMPDLSLFKPLCDTLEITINEFLSGEKLEQEVYQEKLEENIVNTIDYSSKKINTKNSVIGINLLVFGFLITLTAIAIFPSESSWSSIYSILGAIVSLIGFSKFTKKLQYPKRVLFNFLFFIGFIAFLFLLDFGNVKLNNQPPRFSKEIITIDSTIFYDTPFYDVYRCNINKENEYYHIEANSNYTDKSIKEYCK